MSLIQVTFADGSVHDIASGVSAGEALAGAEGKGAVAAVIDGVEQDLATELSASCTLVGIDAAVNHPNQPARPLHDALVVRGEDKGHPEIAIQFIHEVQ